MTLSSKGGGFDPLWPQKFNLLETFSQPVKLNGVHEA